MLGFFIGLLTAIIVIDCILLVLLVLIQLPKKEAGVGVAFGGAATDALFGAGSGTALTKITKYCAGIFLGGTLVLSVMHSHANSRKSSGVLDELGRAGQAPAIVAPATNVPPAKAPGLLTPNTNTLLTPNPAPVPAPAAQGTTPQ